MAIQLQNRESLTIELSKPFTFGHPVVLVTWLTHGGGGPHVSFFFSLLILYFFPSLSSLSDVGAPRRLLAVGRSSDPHPERARPYPLRPSAPFQSQTPSLLRPPARVEQSNLPATCRPSPPLPVLFHALKDSLPRPPPPPAIPEPGRALPQPESTPRTTGIH